MNAVEYSLCIAIIAYVYADMMTEPEMIFDRLYDKLENSLPTWLFKPVVGCSKCVSGQIALWHYLFLSSFDYDIEQHIFIICLTILLTSTIKETHTWIKKKAYN